MFVELIDTNVKTFVQSLNGNTNVQTNVITNVIIYYHFTFVVIAFNGRCDYNDT